MLDYDGTLAPFVRDRLRASMYPGTVERLLRLARIPRLRLVFVSGRPAKELASLLPAALRAEIWGAHGREHLDVDGILHVEPLTQEQAAALEWLERSISDSGLGSDIERKSGSMAIHTRGLATEAAQQLRALVRTLFMQNEASDSAAAGLELLSFDGGIEVRGIGCSKATAVGRILHHEPEGAMAAYLGDDLTDEDAFGALEGRGLRVLVRDEPRASLADVWLRPPEELLAFLDSWLAAMAPPSSELLL
jgi:trehalose-phosphatase